MAHSQPKGRPLTAGALVAIGVSLLTLALPSLPGATEAWQWERSASSSPLSWFTSHLTHWSWNHLIWDLAAFATLSFATLRLIPHRYLFCLLLAAVLIPLEIGWNQPHLTSYRGLSGIDSALFGLALVGLWKAGDRSSPWPRALAGISGFAFLAKTGFELTTGSTLFVSGAQADFIPAVSAHLVGFASGILAGVLPVAFPLSTKAPASPHSVGTAPDHFPAKDHGEERVSSGFVRDPE